MLFSLAMAFASATDVTALVEKLTLTPAAVALAASDLAFDVAAVTALVTALALLIVAVALAMVALALAWVIWIWACVWAEVIPIEPTVTVDPGLTVRPAA